MSGTVRKHHPRGQEKYLEILREGQAKFEHEKKENLIEEIKNKIASLSLRDRLEILNQFCIECGNLLAEDECDCDR